MFDEFRKIPDEEGMRRANDRIALVSTISLVVAVILGAGAWQLFPLAFELPTVASERLVFALKVALVPLLCLAAAILMVSTGRRHSPEDIGGSAAGPPSPHLAVRIAFLQNTFEQVVLAIGAYLVFSATLGGTWLSLIPVSAGMFVLGRALFLIGYRRGVEGRAFGMSLTMLPSLLLLVIAMVAIIMTWHTENIEMLSLPQ